MDFSVLNPRCITTSGLASFPFARRYLENRFFFLFLQLLRCFSSLGLSSYTLLIHVWILTLVSELPHSVISGSQTMCVYPKLFAAYHDLLRLLMPRHSPCALLSLIFKLIFGLHSRVTCLNCCLSSLLLISTYLKRNYFFFLYYLNSIFLQFVCFTLIRTICSFQRTLERTLWWV